MISRYFFIYLQYIKKNLYYDNVFELKKETLFFTTCSAMKKNIESINIEYRDSLKTITIYYNNKSFSFTFENKSFLTKLYNELIDLINVKKESDFINFGEIINTEKKQFNICLREYKKNDIF